MIHFFAHLNWDIIIIFVMWIFLMLCPKIAKQTLIGSCAFLLLIVAASLIILGAGHSISKYTSKYFVIDVQKKESGNYRIIVNKKYNTLKTAKNILYTK